MIWKYPHSLDDSMNKNISSD